MEFIDTINPIAWVLANIILGYTAITIVLFVILYYTLFDPRATTGGKLIFRFMVSLVGLIGIVFLGIYVDPAPDREWFLYPINEVDWWRPTVRLVVYGYVAFTTTALAVLLIKRKWFPHQLNVAPEKELIKVRHETSEIAIVHPSPEAPDNRA